MELLIGDVFRNAARTASDRPAAALGDDLLTFGQIDSAANRIARALDRRGVVLRDRVPVWAESALEVVPLFTALARVGAVCAPMTPRLSDEEATDAASAARPSLLVVDDARASLGGSVGAKLGGPSVTLAELAAS